MDQCRSNPLGSLLAPAAVLIACLAFPVTAQAGGGGDFTGYGSYALSCVAAGQRPDPVSVWLLRQKAGTSPHDDSGAAGGVRLPGNFPARRDYVKERERHDELRRRAELLSQSPRMSRYQSRVDDLRAEDDRKMKAFNVLAGPSGGPAAALPELKRHDDSLEKMVDQAQQMVNR